MSNRLCECGCGEATKASPYTDRPRGYVVGEPMRFVNGHQNRGRSKPVRWRAEDRGHETPCWIWLLTLQSNGYSHMESKVADYRGTAHRWYWIQEHGEPPAGAHLDHLCRNRACVNPDHLQLVTVAENARRGDNAKLTYGDVEEVKRLRAAGLLQREVADLLGVTRQTIGDIERGRTGAAAGGVIQHGV